MLRGFSRRHPRPTYVGLAIATIAAGLLVHLGAIPLSASIRDPLGDALWAVMITWWVSAILPRARLPIRLAIALGTCFAVEFSQLFHTAAIDAVRATTLGHLLLGSGFDARDLAAYTVGVAAAAVLDCSNVVNPSSRLDSL